MKSVTLEEAWAQLRSSGFNHEYEDGWYSIHPDKGLVGWALTAQWLPGRPDIQKVVEQQGKADGRVGGENAWPVDMLQPGDVYVCDHFGLKQDGPSIGDNVGNAIYARSQPSWLKRWSSIRRLRTCVMYSGISACARGNIRLGRSTQLGRSRLRPTSPRGYVKTGRSYQ